MAPEADGLAAVGADGKPAWLQRLMGSEPGGASLRRQHSEASTDDEGGVSPISDLKSTPCNEVEQALWRRPAEAADKKEQ